MASGGAPTRGYVFEESPGGSGKTPPANSAQELHDVDDPDRFDPGALAARRRTNEGLSPAARASL